jgi:hypothetical protein
MKIAILALLVSLSAAADEPKEMYMPNESGGFVTLTIEPCLYDSVKKEYPYRAYATEDAASEIVHEGCWISPSIAEAPKSMKIIPVVNTWWVDGGQVTFLAPQFSPERKRWDEQPIVVPTIKVTPTI